MKQSKYFIIQIIEELQIGHFIIAQDYYSELLDNTHNY